MAATLKLCCSVLVAIETYGSCQLYLQSAKTKQEELEREREGLLDRLDQLTRQTQETSTVNTKYQNELVRLR